MLGSIVTPSSKKHKLPEELKVGELMEEAEAVGGNVARRLAGKYG